MEKFVYSLRISILPNENFFNRINSLIAYCKNYNISDVMFFLDAEEYNSGHTTLEVAEKYVKPLAAVKSLLNGNGITLSLNPWISLGHGDRGRKAFFNDTMVDDNGLKATLTACPLSGQWLKNFLEVYEYYAKTLQPNILWIEDDFRLHNHAPLHFGGCFCDKHIKLYSAYLGEEVSREQFAKGLYSKQTNNKYRNCYMDVNRKIFNEIAIKIKNCVKKYKVDLGIMTSDPNMYAIEGRDNRELLENLVVNKSVYNRIHLPMYSEISPQVYSFNFATLSLLSRFYCSSNTLVMPEIENYPHSYNSKSAKMTAYQVESALPLVIDGITLNIFDFGGNGVYNGEKYGEQLKKIKTYLDTIKSLNIDFSTLNGVVIPVDNNSVKNMQTTFGNDIMELYNFDNWWAGMFASFGISFTYSFSHSFNNCTLAISGQWLNVLTDTEIINIFSKNKILLEAKAVECLLKRNLAHLLGINASKVLPQNQDLFHYQTDNLNLLNIPDGRAPSGFALGDLFCYDYSDNVTEFTTFYHRNGDKAASGITKTNNHLILPFEGYGRSLGLMYPLVEKALSKFILESDNNVLHIIQDNVSVYKFSNCIMIINNSLDSAESLVIEGKKLEFYKVIYNDNSVKYFTNDYLNNHNNTNITLAPLSTCVLVR